MTIYGVDELNELADGDASHVISICDPGQPAPRSSQLSLPYHRLDLRFHDAIVPGPGVVLPSHDHVNRLFAFCRKTMAASRNRLLIHCQVGQFRSTAAAALCLIHARPARTSLEVLGEIVRMRPAAWPNLRLIELGDHVLGRHGELVSAVSALYRRRLDADPKLAEHMRRHGRNREVELAERWR